jgi:hypothetical protein
LFADDIAQNPPIRLQICMKFNLESFLLQTKCGPRAPTRHRPPATCALALVKKQPCKAQAEISDGVVSQGAPPSLYISVKRVMYGRAVCCGIVQVAPSKSWCFMLEENNVKQRASERLPARLYNMIHWHGNETRVSNMRLFSIQPKFYTQGR